MVTARNARVCRSAETVRKATARTSTETARSARRLPMMSRYGHHRKRRVLPMVSCFGIHTLLPRPALHSKRCRVSKTLAWRLLLLLCLGEPEPHLIAQSHSRLMRSGRRLTSTSQSRSGLVWSRLHLTIPNCDVAFTFWFSAVWTSPNCDVAFTFWFGVVETALNYPQLRRRIHILV